MPTYEYLCKNCGHAWEVEQRISADPLTECPSCHQPTAQRQISAGNFILKGGGWYSDLYSSPKPAAKSESKTESTPDAKSETKTETKSESPKTETKTETKPAPTTSEKK